MKNEDNKCFVHSLTSALNHEKVKKNCERLSTYKNYPEVEDFAKEIKLEFPVKIEEKIIKKFEKRFDISINIYSFDYDENYTRYPIYISNEMKEKHINLLYYSDEDETNYHYVWIKKL